MNFTVLSFTARTDKEMVDFLSFTVLSDKEMVNSAVTALKAAEVKDYRLNLLSLEEEQIKLNTSKNSKTVSVKMSKAVTRSISSNS